MRIFGAVRRTVRRPFQKNSWKSHHPSPWVSPWWEGLKHAAFLLVTGFVTMSLLLVHTSDSLREVNEACSSLHRVTNAGLSAAESVGS